MDRWPLHWVLWEQSDRHGAITLTGKALAERLGVKRPWAAELLDSMVAEGRLEKLPGRSRYRVVDPEAYEPLTASPGA